MNPVSLYITASSREEAMMLSRELLHQRLIACANIVQDVTSLYHWQGAIEHDTEVLLVAKTLAAHVDAVVREVKRLHSYECPCVLATAITGGNPDYLKWLGEQVAPEKTPG